MSDEHYNSTLATFVFVNLRAGCFVKLIPSVGIVLQVDRFVYSGFKVRCVFCLSAPGRAGLKKSTAGWTPVQGIFLDACEVSCC